MLHVAGSGSHLKYRIHYCPPLSSPRQAVTGAARPVRGAELPGPCPLVKDRNDLSAPERAYWVLCVGVIAAAVVLAVALVITGRSRPSVEPVAGALPR
jgi:hypothetical protein